MSCSKSHREISDKSVFRKTLFYSGRALLFAVALLFSPIIFLIACATMFETIVLGICPNDSVITKLFKKKQKKPENNYEEGDNNDLDVEDYNVYTNLN